MSDPQQKDLYAVLGCSPTDSLQQLRHGYQQLALQFHPDRSGRESSAEVQSGVEKFLEADAAWRILQDQDARRQYDLQRRDQELQQRWAVDATVSVEDMTLDRDQLVYTYGCRCGGGFSCSLSELENSSRQQDGLVVCCDTCSLSICVSRSLDGNISI